MGTWLSQNWLGRYLICRKIFFEYIVKGHWARDNEDIKRPNTRCSYPR